MRVLLVAITIILLGGSVFGADYYVDAINGNDNNSGTSLSQPWRSILKICYATFAPGDNIYFKRGCIWRNQLSIPNMGAQGTPITFSAYGSGDKPVICAADLSTGWEAHSTNIWKLSNRSPKQIFFNGVRGSKHCVLPEAYELIIDRDQDDQFQFDVISGQTTDDVLRNLGYRTT